MIYTFYSYRGGVGRSMALANIAELLVEAGLSVIMIDWDLEAPGLERFFPVDHVKVLAQPGLMDMLLGYKMRLPPPLSPQATPRLPEDKHSWYFGRLEDYLVEIYPAPAAGGEAAPTPSTPRTDRLRLLTAGRRSKDMFEQYVRAVRTFDWQDFYVNWGGEAYFEWLREQLDQADAVLIDSRTGVSEMGGVCTYHMADVVVLFCATNEQNLDGVYKMAADIVSPETQALRPERPLQVLVVPARVEFNEGDKLNQFKLRFLTQFRDLVPKLLASNPDQLWDLAIPYIPYYAYSEAVPVRERALAIAAPMVRSFENLVRVLAAMAPNRSRLLAAFPASSEEIEAAQRQLETIPLDHVPSPAPLPASSRMPFNPNPLFTDREAELQMVARCLSPIGTTEEAAEMPVVAITGLGGVGKTQVAVEFTHRYGQYFAGGVFWLDFAVPEGIPAEIAQCGGPGCLDIRPDFPSLNLEDQVCLVQAAWQSPLPRLLVFDNCEDEALLAQWRPSHGGCRVLVTSRRASWEPSLGVQLVALGILQRDASLALLRHYCPDFEADDADLRALAAELGDLPLALHLAGNFLARYRYTVTPAAYLAQLRQPDLLTHPSLQGWRLTREVSPTQHEQHVARTFALSYDRLDPADAVDAHALALLARAAYFAPGQPIPRELLLATIVGAERTPDTTLQVADTLGRLLDLGLLEPEVDGAVRLHRLLAVFVQTVARDAAAQTAVEDVVFAAAVPLVSTGYPGPLLALHPHLRAVKEAAQPRADGRTARLNHTLGNALYLLGDYAGAQPAYERALALRERLLGPEHPDVAQSPNSLAELYYAQGRYAAAEPLWQRALAIDMQALGPDHPSTAASLHNLAELYWAQGRYAEAEPLYRRALALAEQVLGSKHPNVDVVWQNYLALLRATNRHAEADSMDALVRMGQTFPPRAESA